MRFWMAVENELNAEYSMDMPEEILGDRSSLWQFMGSRTLVLRHKGH